MWIKREISESIGQNCDLIQVFSGPRQCGKTSLVLRLGPDFEEISLDDPDLRLLAQRDPALLLKQYEGKRIFVDEAQYAPELFPLLKRRADLHKRAHPAAAETFVRITGSNQILLDRQVKESLAGRAAFFAMNTLSVSEVRRAVPARIQDILYSGGWPELHANPGRNVKSYLDNYINSYVEKDVVLAAGIQKQHEFLKFIKLLAGRVGQLLDYASLGRDAGLEARTVKEWISVLARMQLIALVQPFFSNLSKRLIKSPKIFFLDTGLACRLQGWTSPEPILASPLQGALFENLVFAELYKLNLNHRLGWDIFHWRSRDGEEIDFVIQKDPGDHLLIEAKMSFGVPDDVRQYPEVKKVFKNKVPPFYRCIFDGERVLTHNIPIARLREALLP